MKKLRALTHEDHLAIAADIAAARGHLLAAAERCNGRVPAALIDLMFRTAQLAPLRSRLDDLYHRVTSEAQFQEHGHVYYEQDRAGDAARK